MKAKKLLSVTLAVILLLVSVPCLVLTAHASVFDDYAEDYEFGVEYKGAIEADMCDNYRYFRLNVKNDSHVSLSLAYKGNPESVEFYIKTGNGAVVWEDSDIRSGETYDINTDQYKLQYSKNMNKGIYYFEIMQRNYKTNFVFTIDAEDKIALSKGNVTSLKCGAAYSLTATCSEDNNAIGYQFQYSTNEQFKSNVKTVKSAFSSKTISGLTGGKTYYVRVRPYTIYTDGVYVLGQYSLPKRVLVLCSNPKATKIQNTSNGVKLSWSKVTDSPKYRVFRKKGSSNWKAIGNTANLYFIDKNAQKGVTYYYTLRCINNDGQYFLSGYNQTGWKIKCNR